MLGFQDKEGVRLLKVVVEVDLVEGGVSSSGKEPLDALWDRFSGDRMSKVVALEKKNLIVPKVDAKSLTFKKAPSEIKRVGSVLASNRSSIPKEEYDRLNKRGNELLKASGSGFHSGPYKKGTATLDRAKLASDINKLGYEIQNALVPKIETDFPDFFNN